MYAFIVFAVICALYVRQFVSDRRSRPPAKPKRRKYKPHRASTPSDRLVGFKESRGTVPVSASERSFDSVGSSDLRYVGSPASSDYFVYLIANVEHDWLKVGSGQLGRVHQYFNAVDPITSRPSGTGWRVVCLSIFRDVESARLAERQVLRFWHERLSLKQQAARGAFGNAEMERKAGGLTRQLVGGESESVRRSACCEHCTEVVIRSASGFLRETTPTLPAISAVKRSCIGVSEVECFLAQSPRPSRPGVTGPRRESRGRDPRKQTMDLYSYIWENLLDYEHEDRCWPWKGLTLKPRGYGILPWAGDLIVVHRAVWEWVYDDDLSEQRLWNQCGMTACANPRHWRATSAGKDQERLCIAPNCNRVPSEAGSATHANSDENAGARPRKPMARFARASHQAVVVPQARVRSEGSAFHAPNWYASQRA